MEFWLFKDVPTKKRGIKTEARKKGEKKKKKTER
jgi:hypothetical protein